MPQRYLPVPLTLASVAIAGLTLAPLALAQPAAPTHAATTTIQVKAGEMYFKLSSKSLAKPGTVTFVVKNVGHIPHDFKINGKKTALLSPGKTARLAVRFAKKGTYPYLCTVPGHSAAGMKGVFAVR
jgi:uncharacterized cupredoxin-like copper-binding protein